MRPLEAMVRLYGDEAVDALDEEAKRLWTAHVPQDRQRLAWLLLTEAMALEQQGRKSDAGETLRTLLRRFRGDRSRAVVKMLDAARHALEIYSKSVRRPL